MSRRVSVVIAAYDESDNVEPLTRSIHRVMTDAVPDGWELVYVVEGTDGTQAVLERLASELPEVRVLRQSHEPGIGGAFRQGFAAVRSDADTVVTLDADLNHRPDEIPRLLARLDDPSVDIVVGSRFLRASSVVGAPVWKRSISRAVNVLMRWLFGVRTRDKTSGFRAYRAEVVRELTFTNHDYAFLPEILIRAHRAGYRVVEEPIRFENRVAGTSKMGLRQTSASYLRLLRWRVDRWSAAAAALLVAGLAARAVLMLPAGWLVDADASLAGLCALDVLDGEFRAFVTDARLGSAECHVVAAAFAIFGRAPRAMTYAALLLACLVLLAAWLVAREFLGRKLSVLGLAFLAVPTPALTSQLFLPYGYGMIVLTCALVLFFTLRIARGGKRAWLFFGLGAAAGLGLWTSPLTLAATAPCVVWLAWKHRAVVPLRGVAAAGAGLLIGGLPWIAYNVVHPLGYLKAQSSVQPSRSIGQIASNVVHMLDLARKVVAPAVPTTTLAVHVWLPPLVVAIYAAAAAFVVAAVVRRRIEPPVAPSAAWLLVLVAAAFPTFLVLSQAGAGRGTALRYILPMYLVAVPMLVLLLRAIAKRNVYAAGAAACAVVALYLLGHPWPASGPRSLNRWEGQAQAQMVARIQERGIDAAVGDYWAVYPLNLLTTGRVRALPCGPWQDYFRVGRTLEPRDRRWAVVEWQRSDESIRWVERFARESGTAGTLERPAPRYVVFVTEPERGDEAFLSSVRAPCLEAIAERTAERRRAT